MVSSLILFPVHPIYISATIFFISILFPLLFCHVLDSVQSMHYYTSMLLLSLLLLLLQCWYLFISFILSFIFFHYLLFPLFFHPQNRLSEVRVVLIFNASLTLAAPSSPISFTVHFIIFFPSSFLSHKNSNHNTDSVELMNYLSSMLQLSLLLLLP